MAVKFSAISSYFQTFLAIPVISRHFQPFQKFLVPPPPEPAPLSFVANFQPLSAIFSNSSHFQRFSGISSDCLPFPAMSSNFQSFPAISSHFKQFSYVFLLAISTYSSHSQPFRSISSHFQPFPAIPIISSNFTILLADPGEARGCFTNTPFIHSLSRS